MSATPGKGGHVRGHQKLSYHQNKICIYSGKEQVTNSLKDTGS